MRKVVIFIALFMFAPVAVMAHGGDGKSMEKAVERPLEVNLSYGGPQGTFGMDGGAVTTFSAVAEVRYTLSRWISVGLAGGLHDRSRSASLGPLPEDEPEPKMSYDCNLMMNVYANWVNRESFRLYSGVGFGTMGGYVKGDGHPSHGFQFTPVGLSYGRRFYGFAELGMGWMYSLSRAGIGIRF